MTEFSTLYQRILRQVPNCPAPTLLSTIREGAIELCERTRIWTASQNRIVIPKGRDHFCVQAPSNSEIYSIKSVKIGEKVIIPKSVDWLDQWKFDWRKEENNSPDYYYFTPSDDGILVNIIPKASENLKEFISCKIILRPSIESTGMDDGLFSRYRSILVAGALREILMMGDKPWTDQKLASIHSHKFENGVSQVIADSLKSFTNEKIEVNPVQLIF